ncbi:MAG TPA: GNAT family N-acetyltransferase [Allosphingosinicella sp.]|nr:GNAT family N-acetyltransferase [Allosphingosinicella sp.]
MSSMHHAPAGYLHPHYAASLAEFGRPRHLPASGGWLLERPVRGSAAADAMGPYPLFSCRDWSALSGDIQALGESGLVSLVLVADPLGGWTQQGLERCFPDRLLHFKDHFVADLSTPADEFVDGHHLRNVRKALKAIDVERVEAPLSLLDQWCALYGNLVARHGIRGVSAFSRASFQRQLAVPGLTMFCARSEGEPVGITLWYEQQRAAYYHLAAYSDRGYDLRASFAIFWRAFEHFAERGIRFLDLGAGAGASAAADDGLTRFKRGWSNGTRPAWLCGRIFDREAYAALAAARGAEAAAGGYFPAYRRGEFV